MKNKSAFTTIEVLAAGAIGMLITTLLITLTLSTLDKARAEREMMAEIVENEAILGQIEHNILCNNDLYLENNIKAQDFGNCVQISLKNDDHKSNIWIPKVKTWKIENNL